MSVDKLIVLSSSIKGEFHRLARKKGARKWGYGHVLDLRQTDYRLPIILYCDGMHDGRHKIEVVGVAQLGQRRTHKFLRKVAGHLSGLRIYRVDFSVDLLGLSASDVARICHVGRLQNYQVIRSRTGDTFYLQRSKAKRVMLYDKGQQLRAKHDPAAAMLEPGDKLVRMEVQLTGAGVPHRKVQHIHKYADIDLLPGLKFRSLIPSSKHLKPLNAMAALYLASQVEDYGLHATLKQFPSSQRAYIEKIFTQDIDGKRVPDIRRLMRKGIEDWLNDRIRFPRFIEVIPNHDRD